jgi:glycine/D-amino acid oxidase-like deaminating enzyme
MTDYLIVGQGIAGSTLAWTLTQRGYSVHIINNTTLPSSSRAAAGMFNPFAGKKLIRTWQVDELFAFMQWFYMEMEVMLNCRFFHYRSIYRPFVSIEEQNFHLAKTAEPAIARYVETAVNHSQFSAYINNPFAGLSIIQSGWVDVPLMLDVLKNYFIELGQYQESNFDYDALTVDSETVTYQNKNYRKIIFCDGFQAVQNPFFSWLPFNPVKGQTLMVQIENYSITEIVNQGIWILPLNDTGLCKVGSTYTWDKLDDEITAEGRQFIEEKLKDRLKKNYEVLDQQAGVRPATNDRRPFVGVHPKYPNVAILNGLGTKGVTLAPFFAYQLVDFLEHRKEIDPEANISRYFPLYFRSK